MNTHINTIKSVLEGSIADELELKPGDKVLSVDGKRLTDVLDYKFLTGSLQFDLEIQKADGEQIIFEIDNECFEDLGIEFENPLLDEPKSCRNKCIFCFIDQLPGNMRETMYFKDDDYRYSAFLGNYITMTNMTEEDIDRIIRLHLPRINISVHTTNDELRCKMLSNKNAGGIMQKLKKLANAGISMNCQIVLCPGWNDGGELDSTLSDLGTLFPAIKSVSVVPVGITKFRNGLQKLQGFDKISGNGVIRQIQIWQKRFLEKYKTRLVYAGDEFYINNGLPLPSYAEYEEFLQIENGVGMSREFERDFKIASKRYSLPAVTTEKSVVTGTLAYDMISRLTELIDPKIRVYAIQNDFFGPDINVAGLLTGRDIIKQLTGKSLGEYLLVADCMLRDKAFLDDTTVQDVEKALNIKILITKTQGREFVKNLLL